MEKVNEVDYYSLPQISQSTLKLMRVHPLLFKKEVDKSGESEDKDYFTIGSAIDCKITEPDKFNERFIISSVAQPTGQMLTFVKELFKIEVSIERGGSSEERDVELEGIWLYQSSINKAFEEVGAKKSSPDVFLERFKTEGFDYYKFLWSAEDKKVLTQEDAALVDAIVNSLKNSDRTKHIFEELPSTHERIFQLQILFKFMDIEFKSLLDMIIIDHDKKVIYPYDIKTTGESTLFWQDNSFWKYGYDFQAAFYVIALGYYCKVIRPELATYQLDSFKFIVESKSYVGYPRVFKASDTILNFATSGGFRNGRHYKGILQCIEEYKYALANNLWDYTEQEVNNNYEIDIRL